MLYGPLEKRRLTHIITQLTAKKLEMILRQRSWKGRKVTKVREVGLIIYIKKHVLFNSSNKRPFQVTVTRDTWYSTIGYKNIVLFFFSSYKINTGKR